MKSLRALKSIQHSMEVQSAELNKYWAFPFHFTSIHKECPVCLHTAILKVFHKSLIYGCTLPREFCRTTDTSSIMAAQSFHATWRLVLRKQSSQRSRRQLYCIISSQQIFLKYHCSSRTIGNCHWSLHMYMITLAPQVKGPPDLKSIKAIALSTTIAGCSAGYLYRPKELKVVNVPN